MYRVDDCIRAAYTPNQVTTDVSGRIQEHLNETTHIAGSGVEGTVLDLVPHKTKHLEPSRDQMVGVVLPRTR